MKVDPKQIIDSKPIIIDGEITRYIIYSNGTIWSGISNRFLNPSKSQEYLNATICHNGKKYQRYIHRLVADAFIPNPENKSTVNHIDGNKHNNETSNLEWATYAENNIHGINSGLITPLHGEDKPSNIYTEDQIHAVCRMISVGYGNKEIERNVGVKSTMIAEIRRGLKWRYISKEYNFPENYNRNKSYYEFGDVPSTTVRNYIYLGYTNQKIIRSLNLNDSIDVHALLNIFRGRKINHLPRDINRIPSDTKLSKDEQTKKYMEYTKMLKRLKHAQKKSLKQLKLKKESPYKYDVMNEISRDIDDDIEETIYTSYDINIYRDNVDIVDDI